MPVYTIQDPNTGRTVKIEGESPPTEQELEQIFSSLPPQQTLQQDGAQDVEQEVPQQPVQQPSQLMRILSNVPVFGAQTIPDLIGTAETGLSLASGAIAEPVSGLAGIATGLENTTRSLLNKAGLPVALQSSETAAQTVEKIQDYAYSPQTPIGQQKMRDIGKLFSFLGDFQKYVGESGAAAGSDVADALGVEDPEVRTAIEAAFSAAGEALPAAVPEVAGIRGTRQALSQPSRAAREGLIEDGQVTQRGVKAFEEQAPKALTDQEALKQATQAASKGDAQRLAEVADIDQDVLRAAEELDIEIPISSASQNKAFIEAAQSTKFLPDSDLLSQEAAAIAKTQETANNLVRDLGKFNADSTGFDIALNERLGKQIDDIRAQESRAYDTVRDAVGNPEVDTSRARSYIDERLSELGGDETGLFPAEKSLLNLLEREKGTKRPPTYGRIDALRKEIGKGYNRKGQFKDESTASLDRVYNVLTELQEDAIGNIDPSMLEAYQGVKKLTQQRKGIEKSMVNIFGKDAQSGSLSSKINTAANRLIKGDFKQYDQLRKDIPDDLHQDLAALTLDRVFGIGARTAEGLSEGFAKTWNELNKRPSVKAKLYKDLPEGVGKKIDNIGKVWSALIKSKQLQNNSKTARDLFAAMDSGGLSRIFGAAADEAAPMGVRTAIRLARTGGDRFKRASAIERAEKLITSPEFAKAAKAQAVNKGNALEILTSSKAYQDWFNSLPEAKKNQIAGKGFFKWLQEKAEQPALVLQPEEQQDDNM